jgi:hypothetical protein
MPCLMYLQGGPGFPSGRPQHLLHPKLMRHVDQLTHPLPPAIIAACAVPRPMILGGDDGEQLMAVTTNKSMRSSAANYFFSGLFSKESMIAPRFRVDCPKRNMGIPQNTHLRLYIPQARSNFIHGQWGGGGGKSKGMGGGGGGEAPGAVCRGYHTRSKGMGGGGGGEALGGSVPGISYSQQQAEAAASSLPRDNTWSTQMAPPPVIRRHHHRHRHHRRQGIRHPVRAPAVAMRAEATSATMAIHRR